MPYDRASVGMHLHVRLVDLHDVRAGGEEVTDLGVHRGGVVHRQVRIGRVVVVLRQLGHRERTGHRDLDLMLGVRPQELHITHVDRAQPPNAPDHSRHERRLAGAADHRPWMIEVDPVERRRKLVEVTLAPHLAVRHDVDAGALLIANRYQRGVVLRLLEQFGGDTPELPHPHARRRIRGEQRSVDEPFRLRIRADDRCRKQCSGHHHRTPRVSYYTAASKGSERGSGLVQLAVDPSTDERRWLDDRGPEPSDALHYP